MQIINCNQNDDSHRKISSQESAQRKTTCFNYFHFLGEIYLTYKPEQLIFMESSYKMWDRHIYASRKDPVYQHAISKLENSNSIPENAFLKKKSIPPRK